MARISGVDIPREKRLEISLTYIFGIGRTHARSRSASDGISPDTRVRDLTEEEVARSATYIDANLKVEGDLRREVAQDIKRKIEIGSYEGIRHRRASRARPAHPHQRAHPQGPEEDRRRQEEGPQVVAQEEAVAKPKPGGRRPRKRERKNIAYGVAHIKSSFNNTIITITDQQGNILRGPRPATSASRAPARARRSPPSSRPRPRARRRDGARRAQGRRRGEGPRLRPRDRDPLDPEHRHRGHRHQGRHPDPAQRLPPAQAAEGLSRWRATPARSAGSAGASG